MLPGVECPLSPVAQPAFGLLRGPLKNEWHARRGTFRRAARPANSQKCRAGACLLESLGRCRNTTSSAAAH